MDEARTFEDLAWLRRLARRLVRDAARADDAVQQTLLAAGRARGPRSRSWLATVLRNQVRQDARAEARRRERERSRPPRGAAPGSDDLLAELELHQRLAEHVRALDEPYRETLLLRFLREWSPRRIAAHQGVPVKTVHTRIERGLARLRTRLDRAAPREEWLGAMALLAGPRAPIPVPLTSAGAGALLVTMKAKLIAATAVALAALGALPFLLPDGPPSDVARPAPRSRSEARAALGPPGGDVSDGAARTPIASGPGTDAAVSPRAPAAPLPGPLAGRVVGPEGQPIGQVEVVFEPESGPRFGDPLESPRAVSDPDGTFELAPPSIDGRLNCAGELWSALHRPYLAGGAAPDDAPLTLVVVPTRSYGGRVVDPEGAPVGGATVQVSLAESFYEPLECAGEVLPLRSMVAEVVSDERGAFRFDAVGVLEGAFVAAHHAGFERGTRALPPESALDLEVVLDPDIGVGGALRGHVIGPSGVGVQDALVSLGDGHVRSGPGGRFSIDASPRRGGAALRAFHPEAGSSALHLDDARLEAAVAGEELRVLLPGRPRTIRGVVLDASRRRVPHAHVWTPDTTFFGGAPYGGSRRSTSMATIEELGSGVSGPWDRTLGVTADGRGEFALGGLMAREYHVFAADGRTLAASRPTIVGADAERVVLTLEPAPAIRVAGRVVDGRGAPIAGLAVSVSRELDWERPARRNDPWAHSPLNPPGAEVRTDRGLSRTDAEGRFAFDAVVVEGASILLSGDELYMAPRVALEDCDDPEQIEIVVRPRARVRVRCRADADGLVVRTHEDRFQPMYVPIEDVLLSTPEIQVVGGRAVPFETGAGPVTIVLMRAGEVLERIDVVLAPGVNDLRL